MTAHTLRNLLLAIAIATLLVACGGSTSGGDDDDGSTGSGGGGGNSGGDDTPAQTSIRFGAFDNGVFQEGQISANPTELEAGQSSSLQVALVNADGAPITDSADIRFTSQCISDGTSEVDPAVQTVTDGRAMATYTARGCDGIDTITSVAVVGDTTFQANISVQTEAAPAGALTFDSASETQIGIQGSGGPLPEQSNLVFKATNASGGPAPNQLVNFSLNTTTGGITLSNTQDTTDGNGLASTTVTSGSVATTVRVTAQATSSSGASLNAQSSQLAITTGVPDNGSMTIAAERLNLEGYDFAGEQTQITAFLADRFNNPAPDGTAVSFTSEGGSIEGTCLTDNGQCSVTFTSQNPRPSDGRATILATATGEEDFTDSNGNGRFDGGETFVDLVEAFRDDNENGTRDNNELFIDFNDDGQYSMGNNAFDGVLCQPSDCPGAASLNVRDDLVIVLSGSTLSFDVSPAPINLDSGLVAVTVRIEDGRGQVPPSGTTIEAEVTQGSLVGEDSFVQPSTNGPVQAGGSSGVYTFRIEPGDDAGNGLLLLTATTPRGQISRRSVSIQQSSTAP